MSGASWRRWAELNDDEQEQLTWLIDALRHYDAGRSLGLVLPPDLGFVDYRREFISDGLIVYLYAFYAHHQEKGILPIFRGIGCLDLVSSIEALLEVPVGETTFIEALGLHRARLIAHQEFSFDHLQEQYEAKGMHSDDGIAAFVNALRAVQDQTDRLLPTMRNRYPEAAKKWRQPCG